MFERFTDRARRVMVLAAQEAAHCGHSHVGVQHVLLGLVKEGSGAGAHALVHCWARERNRREGREPFQVQSYDEGVQELIGLVRAENKRHTPTDFAAVASRIGPMPRTPGCDELVARANKVAFVGAVGTEHLLLALTEDEDGPAVRAMTALGIKAPAVRAEVAWLIGEGQKPQCCPAPTFDFDKVTLTLGDGKAESETPKPESGACQDEACGLPAPGTPWPADKLLTSRNSKTRLYLPLPSGFSETAGIKHRSLGEFKDPTVASALSGEVTPADRLTSDAERYKADQQTRQARIDAAAQLLSGHGLSGSAGERLMEAAAAFLVREFEADLLLSTTSTMEALARSMGVPKAVFTGKSALDEQAARLQAARLQACGSTPKTFLDLAGVTAEERERIMDEAERQTAITAFGIKTTQWEKEVRPEVK